MRVALPLILSLVLASPASALTLASGSSTLVADCNYSGGSAPDPDPLSLSSPGLGANWSVSGSYCGFDYSVGVAFDFESGRISLDGEIIDRGSRYFTDPQNMGVRTATDGFVDIKIHFLFADEGPAVLFDTDDLELVVVPGPFGDEDTWVPRRNEVANLADWDFNSGLRLESSQAFPHGRSVSFSREIHIVPEPGSAALLALGLATAAARSRSRRR